VGDGPLRKDLATVASALEIGNHIHFMGWQEDVGPFLSVFDIGVNCSANEGFSNAIMEYMTYGVPCIVSDAGGNPELVEHGINGYTFELDNDEELANQIIGLLDNKERQKEFVSKSKQKILEQLTLEKMIDAYDRYFTQILGITA
jgi:glycosyltransferase involved in cell wall biosynthesis